MSHEEYQQMGDANEDESLHRDDESLAAKLFLRPAELRRPPPNAYRRTEHNNDFAAESATDTPDVQDQPDAVQSSFSLSVIENIRPNPLDLFTPSSRPADSASRTSESSQGDTESAAERVPGDQSGFTVTPSGSMFSFEIIQDSDKTSQVYDDDSDDLSFTNIAIDDKGHPAELEFQENGDNVRSLESAGEIERAGRQQFWTNNDIDLEGYRYDHRPSMTGLHCTQSGDLTSILKMLDSQQQYSSSQATTSPNRQQDELTDRNWAEIDRELQMLSQSQESMSTDENISMASDNQSRSTGRPSTYELDAESYHRNQMFNAQLADGDYEQADRVDGDSESSKKLSHCCTDEPNRPTTGDYEMNDRVSVSSLTSCCDDPSVAVTPTDGVSFLSHLSNVLGSEKDEDNQSWPKQHPATELSDASQSGQPRIQFDSHPARQTDVFGRYLPETAQPIDYSGQELFFRNVPSSSWTSPLPASEQLAVPDYAGQDLFFYHSDTTSPDFQDRNESDCTVLNDQFVGQDLFFRHSGMGSSTWQDSLNDTAPMESYAGQELFFRHPGIGSTIWETDRSTINLSVLGPHTLESTEELSRYQMYNADDRFSQPADSEISDEFDAGNDGMVSDDDDESRHLETAEQNYRNNMMDRDMSFAREPSFTDCHLSSYTPDSGSYESNSRQSDDELEGNLLEPDSAHNSEPNGRQSQAPKEQKYSDFVGDASANALEAMPVDAVPSSNLESGEHFNRSQPLQQHGQSVERGPSCMDFTAEEDSDVVDPEHTETFDDRQQMLYGQDLNSLTREPSCLEYSTNSESDSFDRLSADSKTSEQYFTFYPLRFSGLEADGTFQHDRDPVAAESMEFTTRDPLYNLLLRDTHLDEMTDHTDLSSAQYDENEHYRTNTPRYDYYDETSLVDYGLSPERQLLSPADFLRDRLFDDRPVLNSSGPGINEQNFQKDSFDTVDQMNGNIEEENYAAGPDSDAADEGVRSPEAVDACIDQDTENEISFTAKRSQHGSGEMGSAKDPENSKENLSEAKPEFQPQSADYSDSHDAFMKAVQINEAADRERRWKSLQTDQQPFGQRDSWHMNGGQAEQQSVQASLGFIVRSSHSPSAAEDGSRNLEHTNYGEPVQSPLIVKPVTSSEFRHSVLMPSGMAGITNRPLESGMAGDAASQLAPEDTVDADSQANSVTDDCHSQDTSPESEGFYENDNQPDGTYSDELRSTGEGKTTERGSKANSADAEYENQLQTSHGDGQFHGSQEPHLEFQTINHSDAKIDGYHQPDISSVDYGQRNDINSSEDQALSLDDESSGDNLSGMERFESDHAFQRAPVTFESAEVFHRDREYRAACEHPDAEDDMLLQMTANPYRLSDPDGQVNEEIPGGNETIRTLESAEVLHPSHMYDTKSSQTEISLPIAEEMLSGTNGQQKEDPREAAIIYQPDQYFSPLSRMTVESAEAVTRAQQYQHLMNESAPTPIPATTIESAEVSARDQLYLQDDENIRQPSAVFDTESDVVSTATRENEYLDEFDQDMPARFYVSADTSGQSVDSSDLSSPLVFSARDWKLADHVSLKELENLSSQPDTNHSDILKSALSRISAQQLSEQRAAGPYVDGDSSTVVDAVNGNDYSEFEDGLSSGNDTSAQQRRQPLKTANRRSWGKMEDLSTADQVDERGNVGSLNQPSENRIRTGSTSSRKSQVGPRESTAGLYSMYNPSADLGLKQAYTVKPTRSTAGPTGALISPSVESSGFHTQDPEPPLEMDEGQFNQRLCLEQDIDTGMPEGRLEFVSMPEHPVAQTEEWMYDKEIVKPFQHMVEVIQDDIGTAVAAVLIYPCLFPRPSYENYGQIMNNLHFYIMNSMASLGGKAFRIVLFNSGTSTVGELPITLITQLYKSMDRELRSNLKQLLIVHPSLKLKTELKTAGRAVLSKDFYTKIVFAKSLQDLSRHQFLQFGDVPKPIRDHDKRKQTKVAQNTCC